MPKKTHQHQFKHFLLAFAFANRLCFFRVKCDARIVTAILVNTQLNSHILHYIYISTLSPQHDNMCDIAVCRQFILKYYIV